jgi:hypothetical protein
VSPVKYELGFYIPEDDILHRHRRENLKSYISTNCRSLDFSHTHWLPRSVTEIGSPSSYILLPEVLRPDSTAVFSQRRRCNAYPCGWNYMTCFA